MQHKVLNNEDFFNSVFLDFSINVTEMFRDVSFFKKIRSALIPIISDYPLIKIWHAGCSTGEEVYSLAIVLKEHGLYERCKIYATDINEIVLAKAKRGIYPLDRTGRYARNYRLAGGECSFAEYFKTNYNSAIIMSELKRNIIFSYHNLATDQAFGEMDVIFCRNVLIYFDNPLINKVIGLFYNCLKTGGILCLGSKESPQFTDYWDYLTSLSAEEKIYRKKDCKIKSEIRNGPDLNVAAAEKKYKESLV
jgi:chemotaxis protein methyltransferase CheR